MKSVNAEAGRHVRRIMFGLDEQRLSWKIERSIFFFYGFTNSKGTYGNKMLQYVPIKDKYKLNVIKYTTTVSAGNF